MALDEESPDAPPAPPGLLAELNLLGRAFRELLGAQWELLRAEFGLARSAVWWMLLAGLAATVAGVGFGLSVLALVGVALAKWWGSWLWALFALAVLQLMFLLAASMMFRRCLHWLTLPRSRGHWASLLRDATHPRAEPGPARGRRSTPDVATTGDKAASP
ncbi:MAG: ABC transporter ATP-binding protein [Rhodanobacter sp.]